MSVARTLFDPRGSVGRGPLWTFYLVRTLLGIGLIKISVTDAVWDDWYKTVLSVAFAWPTYVALPIKRLRDLGHTWRIWAGVWTATAVGTAAIYVFGLAPLGYSVTDLLGGITMSPVEVPPVALMIGFPMVVLHLVYGIALYFAPGASARATRARADHAVTA